ncbi:AMP-binding protein [Nocardia terpenica]|uniref:condensation domain-containing protein n=1 Tax=Nocardia terpenica TaxID=455432 RepID=UPI00189513B5|nr:condensation domain-containing protein [Nocardia terpenica]MBF6063667.1 AMP-binding protein [Nocardia terpenica]MBF6107043.1 AMP-binding protein [Nocardia terpenica]MBF6114216.1 AMP-binding protein [Nocardia terpenica]MBF6121697.1 AMP-binding protein [Nocardia terpenica]MBF6154112.1 AMP-binding protein [Nocardia terpenica]
MNSPASNLALAKLREKRAAGIGAQGIPARTGTGPFPATPAQRGIWLHEQLAANDALYHVPLGIRITGELDVDALHTAASAVVAEQHALRTVFTEAAGLRGEVVDDVEIDWETHDLRLVPEAVRPQALDELLTTVSTARFDLVGGRPVRWALIRLGATDWLLAVVAHHLVLDGLSIPVLIEQLWSAYGGLRSVAMPTLTPVRQYADFAEWIDRQPPRTAAIERRAGLVRGVPPLDLSVGRPRPPRVGNDGAKVQLPVPPETTAAVREAAAAHGVPPFVFLLACYQLALAAHTGRDDFAVGIPMAARPYDELARTIGHFVNTVPVRSVLAAGQSFAELLRATRDSALAAYEDETVPFEGIIETLGGPWDPRYSPVFQVLFVQQRLERPDLSSLGLSVDWHPIDTGATLYDLVLHVAEAGDDLVCETTFNTAILDEPAARRLTGDLITLAATAAADPTITVADLLRTTPHHHLLIQVATPAGEEVSAGLAEALYRGGVPARVVAESADASAGSPGDSGVLLAGIRSAAGDPGQKHAGITGEGAGIAGEHAGVAGEGAGVAGEHAGVAGEGAGIAGEHAGNTGEGAGVAGEGAGVAGERAGVAGGTPAGVLGEVRAVVGEGAVPQGRSDLIVVGAGFVEGDEGAAVELAEECTRAGVGLVVLVPKGVEVAPVLAAQGVIVEVEGDGDSYGLGWGIGRRVLSWAGAGGPAGLAPAVAAWLAQQAAVEVSQEPERVVVQGDSAVEFESPNGPVETRLAELWARALEVPVVGRHDDFFLLGGTSLGATRLLSQVLDEFGVTVSLRELFERPTVAQAASLVESAAAERDSGAALVAVARADGEPLPVSYAQERLWFLETLDPGNSTYIMPGGLRLRGKVDVRALEVALALVERRHEVLRTVYRTTDDGQLRQIVRPHAARPLPYTDLSDLAAPDRERAENELAATVYTAPFDLAEGPVWRYHLVETGPDEYLLMMALHHIVCDGWSIAVLSQEVSAHYRAQLSGLDAELPPLAVQYADYAQWQRDSADHLDAQLEHWRDTLTGAQITEIPGDRRRPARRTSRGAVERGTLDPELMAAVRRIAADRGVTNFAVLLSAFYAMLHRYTRQQDLIVASPIAGRTRSATEPLVGCFLNTLALRTAVDPEEPGTELVARVGRVVLAAHENQECPFERVIAALVPNRDMSRTPLAQIMFNYLNTPPPVLDMAGVGVEMVDAPRRTAKMDLDLTVDETGGDIRLSLEYSTDLYDADTARRLLRHYVGALTSLVEDPRRPVGHIALGEPEHPAPAWELPGVAVVPDPEPGESLADRLAHVARTRGGATALSNDERRASYAELDALADHTAQMLLGAGAADGGVALLYDHTPESFVAVWAAVRAGVPYMPLDPRAPQARLTEILAEAKVGVVLCDPSLVDTARAIAGPARVLPVAARTGEAHLSPGPIPHVDVGATADRPAYVTYTSGSTGRPKGVAQSSQAALAHAICYAQRLRIGPGDIVAAPARYTFDAGILNSFGAAVAGAELHVIDPHLFTPAALRTEIDSAGVTVLHCTPTLFRYLLSDAAEPWLPQRIRVVGLGGEEVVRGDVIDFGRHFGPECRLVSLYGPTECSVALQHLVTAADADGAGVPIGFPVDGVEIDLVDESGRPTEVFGELVLRSPRVALGYWERPELTEAVFGVGPDGVRYYRTGDLARRGTDGRLIFVGRKDRQVKIRGHRVEPGEAETALRSHPTVGEAAVVLDREAAEPRLVAYVTQDGPLEPDYGELAAYLRTRLPDYMIPSAYLVLPALPRGLTGKLDQNRLPRIAPAAAAEFVPPRTDLERVVAQVWAEVLDREVGLGQNFFDLGGHSLALARARGLLERRLGVQLAMTDLFAAPTVEDLGRLLAGRTTPQEDTDRGLERRAAAARRRAHRRPGASESNGSKE